PTRLCREPADATSFYATGAFSSYASFATKNAARIRFSDGSPVTTFLLPDAPGFGPNDQITDALPVPGGGIMVNGPYTMWDGAVARNLVKLDGDGQDYSN